MEKRPNKAPEPTRGALEVRAKIHRRMELRLADRTILANPQRTR
jgi:hypothetical protein